VDVQLARDRLHPGDASLARRPRESDGVWAPYWYESVWQSTGFEPRRPRSIDLSPHDEQVAETCRDAYEFLAAQRVSV
jgi:hypothetical protein